MVLNNGDKDKDKDNSKKKEKSKERDVNNYKPKIFTSSYIKSPKYKERLQSSGYKNVDKEIKKRKNSVENAKTTYQLNTPTFTERIKKSLKGEPYTTRGSIAKPSNVIVDINQAIENKTSTEKIETHEYSHQETGINSNRLNEYDKKKLREKLYNPKNRHDRDPQENKADLNSIRYELYKKGIDVFNKDIKKEHLELLNHTDIINQRMFRNYKERDLIWLLNNIAINSDNNQKYKNIV